MKYKTSWTMLGFLLFFFGLMSLILSVAGLQYSFLKWLEYPGKTFGLIAKIVMIFAGVLLVSIVQTDWDREKEEIRRAKAEKA